MGIYNYLSGRKADLCLSYPQPPVEVNEVHEINQVLS
jgi:hypothetical protein